MADKTTKLSIVISTVDKATAKIKAINAQLDAATKPIRGFKEALGDLKEKSGLDDVLSGFKGVGSAVGDLLGKLAMIGGVAVVAVAGLLHLVDEFDDLGKKAAQIGVTVDFLAQMRDAAERTGVPVESLDQGLEMFSVNLGKAQAGTGRMAAFLKKVNPEFLKQLQHAKSNEEAFRDLADALEKEHDAARRSALANAALGDPKLAPLLMKGSKGLDEMAKHFTALAGPQGEAAAKAAEVHEAMLDVKDAAQGVEAALVVGLGPAIKEITAKLTTWLSGHRAQIAEWIANLGKKLPGAVAVLVDAVKGVVGDVMKFIDAIGGWKGAAVALAAVLVGPLLSAIVTLGVALLTTPVGLVIASIAALAIAWEQVIFNWDGVKRKLGAFWDFLVEKTHGAVQVLKILLFPFIGLPGLIISNWGHITDFFGALWDGVKAVFAKAWEFIKGIVDKVIGAVDAVKDAVGSIVGGKSIGDVLSGDPSRIFGGGNVAGQAGAAVAPSSFDKAMAHITVDFANMPRGGKVSVAPQSTADVDLSVGYNLLGATP